MSCKNLDRMVLECEKYFDSHRTREMLNWPIIIFLVKPQTYMHIMIENEEAGGYKWQLTMGMIGLQGNSMSD